MSATDTPVLIERRDGATVILTLNEPGKRNALTPAIRLALAEAIDRIERDPGIRAVVVTGGPAMFSAGGDLTAMQVDGLAAGRERFRLLHGIVRAIVKSGKPYIAAVEGWAAGAGFSLALLCDTIVAAEGARFVASFPKVGLVADVGLLHTLPARVGQGRARQMLLRAEPVGAPAALAMGMVDEVVPDGTALDRALALARGFEGLAPLSTALTKEWLARGIDEVLDWERSAQAALFQTADHHEGKAAFFEKRRPAFQGR
ncbi:enoyl-CoA hydratase/isomerase family protein [Methylobacterium platani]|uniref:Enoyl-CoA hydratase n=2 Tax=Methylobacterium platani TaxID=427683 RepID=A0A179RYT7_9HYPH|nr:enoyl-CoA hydratase/isomerase family protein [Methylobacterium platani]KMO13639.1 enoyl-CoA hydratase [Methylobacterium platani JCM 14648]OAS15874.1 enoyl-CoA hydratase [Methylobacterium platani]